MSHLGASGEGVDLYLDCGLFLDVRVDDFIGNGNENGPPQRRWLEGEVVEVRGREILVHFMTVNRPDEWISVDCDTDRISELHTKCFAQSSGLLDSDGRERGGQGGIAGGENLLFDVLPDIDELFTECMKGIKEQIISMGGNGVDGSDKKSWILNIPLEKAKETFITKWLNNDKKDKFPKNLNNINNNHKPMVDDNHNDNDYDSDSEQLFALQCPLYDSLSLCRLQCPVRGQHCTHVSSFDLRLFLEFNQNKHNVIFECPICKKEVMTDEVICDTFLLSVVNLVNNNNGKGKEINHRNYHSTSPSLTPCVIFSCVGDQMESRHVIVNRDGEWRVEDNANKSKRKASVVAAPTGPLSSSSSSSSSSLSLPISRQNDCVPMNGNHYSFLPEGESKKRENVLSVNPNNHHRNPHPNPNNHFHHHNPTSNDMRDHVSGDDDNEDDEEAVVIISSDDENSDDDHGHDNDDNYSPSSKRHKSNSSSPSPSSSSSSSSSSSPPSPLCYPVVFLHDIEHVDLTGSDRDDPFYSDYYHFFKVKKEKEEEKNQEKMIFLERQKGKPDEEKRKQILLFSQKSRQSQQNQQRSFSALQNSSSSSSSSSFPSFHPNHHRIHLPPSRHGYQNNPINGQFNNPNPSPSSLVRHHTDPSPSSSSSSSSFSHSISPSPSSSSSQQYFPQIQLPLSLPDPISRLPVRSPLISYSPASSPVLVPIPIPALVPSSIPSSSSSFDDFKLNVNVCSANDFQEIGLSFKQSLTIVDERRRFGKFTQWKQIKNIKGIGKKAMEIIQAECKME